MIHALHGNAGLPDDIIPLLSRTGLPFEAWHLWRLVDEWPGAATLSGFATAFQTAVDQRADRPRVLFGYSLGARLALHVLTAFPDKWDAAVLLSAHPGLQNAEDRAARLALDQTWSVRFLREPWREVMAAWNAQPVLAGEAIPPHDQGLLETWRREIALAFNAWSLGRQDDLRPLLPVVKCPVLWLTGAKDEKFTALAAAACPLMPRSTHLVIPDAGHRVHLDQPAAVESAIGAFLVKAGC